VGAQGSHVPQDDLTRRGALAAAAAGLLAGVLPAGTARAAGPAGGLDPRRAAAFERLVTALHRAPDPRFAHLPARTAARAFAAWYAGQDAVAREHADAVLDRLAAGPAPDPADLERAAPAPDAAVLAAGIALAAVACDPLPDEDERPDLPALGVAA